MIRPVKCLFCHKRMYYADDERYEEEVEIHISSRIIDNSLNTTHYAHIRCWRDGVKAPSRDIETPNYEWFRKGGK